jgi:hypothetical protein
MQFWMFEEKIYIYFLVISFSIYAKTVQSFSIYAKTVQSFSIYAIISNTISDLAIKNVGCYFLITKKYIYIFKYYSINRETLDSISINRETLDSLSINRETLNSL